MNVRVPIQIEDEYEVDVSLHDVMAALPGELNAETIPAVQRLISRCHACLASVPEAMIEQLTPEARKLVRDALYEQAKRYEEKPAVGGCVNE